MSPFFLKTIVLGFDMIRAVLASLASVLIGGPAFADFEKIQERSAFVSLIKGKNLTLPFVKLAVEANGKITGYGARWAINGNWSWQDGFFCRDINWGGSDLGYNCQAVEVKDSRIRFTSDKGAGDSATFRLK
jgi:hypothetical protein